MEFDSQRFLQLRNKKDKFSKQGLSFEEFDKESYTEWYNSVRLLYDDLFWIYRSEYLKIIELFMAGSIDGDTFYQQFNMIQAKDEDRIARRLENLKSETIIQLNPKSRGFYSLLLSIYLLSDSLLEYMDDSEFRTYFKNNFLEEFRDYCSE